MIQEATSLHATVDEYRRRMVAEWGQMFAATRKSGSERFGIEHATEAASLEVMHQTEQWGEVEDTHDVDGADIRRQLGTVVLLVS